MSTDSDTPARALARVEPVERERELTLIEQWDDTIAQVRTSLDMTTDDGFTDAFHAWTTSDAQAMDVVGQLLLVRGWLIHPRELVDTVTGEVRPALRLVLILDDGKTVSTASPSMIDNWALVAKHLAGRVPYPKLEVTLAAIKRRTGEGRYLQVASVRVVSEKATKPTKK